VRWFEDTETRKKGHMTKKCGKRMGLLKNIVQIVE
jgi:hypothetical protein